MIQYYCTEIKDAFNLLEDLCQLDTEGLKEVYRDINIKHLKILSLELLDTSLQESCSYEDFEELVFKSSKIKKVWAQYFSKAIILETRRAKTGGANSAVEVLDDFIKSCPVPFFRNMAINRRQRY